MSGRLRGECVKCESGRSVVSGRWKGCGKLVCVTSGRVREGCGKWVVLGWLESGLF